MKIAAGIKGIRRFLATADEATSGWHVYCDDADLGFTTETAREVIERMSADGATFIGWTGNGLSFARL